MKRRVKKNEIIFSKLDEGAIIPTKENGNAGRDIYSSFDTNYIVILPSETKMIPTGIASALHPKWYFKVEERGNTGAKGMKVSAGVIDSNYRGEWFVQIYNANAYDPIIISKLNKEQLIEYSKSMYNEECSFSGYHALRVDENSDKEENDIIFIEENDSTIIYPYDKAIAQVTLHHVPKMKTKEIHYADLLNIKSDRGTGKLGSSGK